MPRPETQTPMARPHPTPQKNHSPNASPNGTAQKTADLTKRCACAVNSTSIIQHLTFPHVSTLFDTNLARHVFIRNPLQKLPPMAAALAPYCGGRRTVANAETTCREQDPTPRPPELNENPSLCIREKERHSFPSMRNTVAQTLGMERFKEKKHLHHPFVCHGDPEVSRVFRCEGDPRKSGDAW